MPADSVDDKKVGLLAGEISLNASNHELTPILAHVSGGL